MQKINLYFSNFTIDKLVPAVSALLFILPFFWLSPGELDLGGDAARLYFYDPVSYLRNLSLYLISPEGTGNIIHYQFSTPFLLLLILLKKIIVFPYVLISLFKSLELTAAFLFAYLSVYELLSHNVRGKLSEVSIKLSALIVGLFYLLNPISQYGGWDHELFDHFQIFMNPLMFYLSIKYIHTQKSIFLFNSLLISFVFSVNFSLTSAAKFFAFYPLMLIFLGLYITAVKKGKIYFRKLLLVFLIFLSLQAFHLVPLLSTFTQKDTITYDKVFTQNSKEDAVNFFTGLSSYITLYRNLFLVAPTNKSVFDFLYVLFPAILITGSLMFPAFTKKRRISPTLFTLVFSMFLISCYFATGKITSFGFNLYKFMFNFPGFTMFRSFFGQWAHAYVFYYSIFLGITLFMILDSIGKYKKYIVSILIIIVILLRALPFIAGETANRAWTKSAGIDVKGTVEFEEEYVEALRYIRSLPSDGKILTLPLTDYFYQIVAGKGTGVYLGPSTISYLTEKNDFAGYHLLTPYSELFESYVKRNDYESLNELFALLNIQYIFYNSDPRVLHNFLDFPYQHARQYLPTTQPEYFDFIEKLGVTPVKSFGKHYHLYEINSRYRSTRMYVSSTPIIKPMESNPAGYLTTDFVKDVNYTYPMLFIDKGFNISSALISGTAVVPGMTYRKVDPTRYEVDIKNAQHDYFIVLLNAYNPYWKVFIKTNRDDHRHELVDTKHTRANGYANAWHISPDDVGHQTEYTLSVEFTAQKYIHLGNIITGAGLLVIGVWLLSSRLGPIKKPLNISITSND